MIDDLIEAAEAGDIERLRVLVTGGADPNGRDDRGNTALYGLGDAHAVRALVALGADPNLESTTEGDGLPLCFAACWGDAEVVLALLEGGADPNLREDGGTGGSPLTWAAGHGHTDAVRALLSADADANLPDGHGRLPLHAAAQQGSLSVVRALLDAGADPAATESDGRVALELAEEWLGKDVEVELRRLAEGLRKKGDRISVRRVPRPDGTELIEVKCAKALSGWGFVRETGFDAIVELLRAASHHTEPR